MLSTLLVALLVPVAAQDSVAVGNFVIQGYVVSDVAAIRARGLTVVLFKSDGTTIGQTQTDDTGKFRFRGLTKGAYEVVVQLEGHAPLRELVAMSTQNQIYDVQLYLRTEARETRPKPGAVDLAYLKLPRRLRSEFDRAVRWTDEGKYERSVASLRRVVAAQPGFAPAHNQLGIGLYHFGALDPAP